VLSPKTGLSTVIFLLFFRVGTLSGMDISLEAVVQNDCVLVNGRITSFDSIGLPGQLDSGGTARLIWVFRLGGQDETLTRYVRRDLLGSGYIISTLVQGADARSVPVGEKYLLEELFTLNNFKLSTSVPLENPQVLQCRVSLDPDMLIPPLSILSLLRGKRERSSWVSVSCSQYLREDS